MLKIFKRHPFSAHLPWLKNKKGDTYHHKTRSDRTSITTQMISSGIHPHVKRIQPITMPNTALTQRLLTPRNYTFGFSCPHQHIHISKSNKQPSFYSTMPQAPSGTKVLLQFYLSCVDGRHIIGLTAFCAHVHLT